MTSEKRNKLWRSYFEQALQQCNDNVYLAKEEANCFMECRDATNDVLQECNLPLDAIRHMPDETMFELLAYLYYCGLTALL